MIISILADKGTYQSLKESQVFERLGFDYEPLSQTQNIEDRTLVVFTEGLSGEEVFAETEKFPPNRVVTVTNLSASNITMITLMQRHYTNIMGSQPKISASVLKAMILSTLQEDLSKENDMLKTENAALAEKNEAVADQLGQEKFISSELRNTLADSQKATEELAVKFNEFGTDVLGLKDQIAIIIQEVVDRAFEEMSKKVEVHSPSGLQIDFDVEEDEVTTTKPEIDFDVEEAPKPKKPVIEFDDSYLKEDDKPVMTVAEKAVVAEPVVEHEAVVEATDDKADEAVAMEYVRDGFVSGDEDDAYHNSGFVGADEVDDDALDYYDLMNDVETTPAVEDDLGGFDVVTDDDYDDYEAEMARLNEETAPVEAVSAPVSEMEAKAAEPKHEKPKKKGFFGNKKKIKSA